MSIRRNKHRIVRLMNRAEVFRTYYLGTGEWTGEVWSRWNYTRLASAKSFGSPE